MLQLANKGTIQALSDVCCSPVRALLTAISTAPPPGTSLGSRQMLRATPIASCKETTTTQDLIDRFNQQM
jgi:hypothetical protein